VVFAVIAHAIVVDHSSERTDHPVQFRLVLSAGRHLVLKFVQLVFSPNDPVLVGAGKGHRLCTLLSENNKRPAPAMALSRPVTATELPSQRKSLGW
jgi:hypothetical protein